MTLVDELSRDIEALAGRLAGRSIVEKKQILIGLLKKTMSALETLEDDPPDTQKSEHPS